MGQSVLRQEFLRSHGPGLARKRATRESRGTRLLTQMSKTWNRWSRCVRLLYFCPLDSTEVHLQMVSPCLLLPREMLADSSEFFRAQVTFLWRVPLSFGLAASASTADEGSEDKK